MMKDYVWIRGVIYSCQNSWQLEICNELVKLFAKKYFNSAGMMDDRYALFDAIETKKKEFNPPMPDIKEGL